MAEKESMRAGGSSSDQQALDPGSAFLDCLEYLQSDPERWASIPRKRKQYLSKARIELGKDKLGPVRINSLISEFAPERYEHIEVYLVKT